MKAPDDQPKPRLYRVLLIALVGTALLVTMLYPLVRLRLRAASLLLRIQDAHATGSIAGFATHPIDETPATIDTANGPVPARRYTPRGVAHPPGMVVLHGVHHLGVEEPRLVNFSRALAASGIEVLTPELQSLADYRVDERDLAVIGAAAQTLRQRTGRRVGMLGLSFAGGLALVSAADPRYAGDIGFVFSIGGYDDLERVCRYLATGQVAWPDGGVQNLPSHEYGALVVVYSHPDTFFAPQDVPAATDALRLQLGEDLPAARAQLERLTPEGRARMQILLDHKPELLAAEILKALPRHTAEMERVSPHSHLAGLRVPVLLLHGSGDNVIPAAETQWLAQDVPQPWLRKALISPLLTHVEVDRHTSWRDKLAIVEFMAAMLREVDALEVK